MFLFLFLFQFFKLNRKIHCIDNGIVWNIKTPNYVCMGKRSFKLGVPLGRDLLSSLFLFVLD